MFFVATLLFLYIKVSSESNIDDIVFFFQESISAKFFIYIVLTFMLMFLNWGFEAYKWKEILKETHKISFVKSLKAIFSGNSTGIFTPNRLGAFIGRILHLPEGLRAEGTLTTWVGNAAQLLATLVFGAIGALIFYVDDSFVLTASDYTSVLDGSLLLFSVLVTTAALLGYFFSGRFISWFSRVKFLAKHLNQLEKINTFSAKQLSYYLLLSVLRYLVFVFQFYFLFKAFSVNLSLYDTLVYVGVLYIIIAFMPTFLGKLGVRESVLIILLAHLPYAEIQIISASFSLWLINTIFPAILGAFFITQINNK